MRRDPQIPIIMITAHGTVDNACAPCRAARRISSRSPGTTKSCSRSSAAVARRRAEEENEQLKRALKQRYRFSNIVGKSDPMLKVFDLVAQVASSRSTMLIQGESGTGKELIAKAVHAIRRAKTGHSSR